VSSADPRTLRARSAVESLPTYRPGRSAEQAAAEHGAIDAVKLASNELPFDPLPSVAKALVSAIGEANRYPDHLARTLREHLARHHQTTPDRIAVGCGTVGLLEQLALAYVDPGDSVIYAEPSFEAYPIFTQLSGGIAHRVPLRRLTHDARGLLAALDERSRLVLVAQPNNPTSTAMTAADVKAIAAGVPDNCVLVIDEAYHEFSTGRHLLDATRLLADHSNLVVLRTFSKAHGLAGLRVGYALGAPPIVATLDKVLIPFSVNRLGQIAAIASLDAPGELDDRVESVLSSRDLLCGELRHSGWSVPDTQANFVFLPAGEASDDLGVALERQGLVTRAFAGVGVRVTVGRTEQVDRFAEAFARISSGEMSEQLHASWGLPTGVEGRAVAGWLDRLDAVDSRLAGLASGRRKGLTDPDPGGDERWEDGQVWAHLAEFGSYWIDELELVLDRASTRPVPFGRTKSDPDRIAAIAAGHLTEPSEQFRSVGEAIDRLRAVITGMSSADWGRVGQHPTLGPMAVEAMLEEFLVGHYEQHAAQLESLGDGG